MWKVDSSFWRRRDKGNGHVSKPVCGQRGVALAFLVSPSLFLSSFPSFLWPLPWLFFSLFLPHHCFTVAFLCYITLCGSFLLSPNCFLVLCVDPSPDCLLAASSLAQLCLSCSSSLSSLLTLPIHSKGLLFTPCSVSSFLFSSPPQCFYSYISSLLYPLSSVTWT